MGLPEELYTKLLILRDVSKKHGIPLWLHVLRQQDMAEMLLEWRDDERAMFQFADINLPAIRDLVCASHIQLPLPVAKECYELMPLLELLSHYA